MAKLLWRIITENQPTREKAERLAAELQQALPQTEILKIEKYYKFPESFCIDLKTLLKTEISSEEFAFAMLDFAGKIASPWEVYFQNGANEFEMIFNKSEHTRFLKSSFNVIRWMNVQRD